MDPTLADGLAKWMTRAETLALAKVMTGPGKFPLGALLFDHECERAKADIRARHPGADETMLRQLLADWVRHRFGES